MKTSKILQAFFTSTLILLISVIIEVSIFSNISAFPIIPDLSLLCLLYVSIHDGKLIGETTGFLSGLFLDFLSAGPMGLNCVYRVFFGYLCGLFSKTLNTEGFFIPLLLGTCATLVKAIFLFIVTILFPGLHLANTVFSYTFLCQIIENILITPFVFKFLSLFKKYLLLNPENIV